MTTRTKTPRQNRRDKTSRLAAAGGLANVGVIAAYEGGAFDPADLGILECSAEVGERARQARGGNTAHVTGLLMAQALALNSIFTKLAIKAAELEKHGQPHQVEQYLRVALKAQSQGRATLETLMAIGHPSVVFAQQANVAFGPQQVNNGTAPTNPTQRSGEDFPVHELNGDSNVEQMDTRAASKAVRGNSTVVSMAALDRPAKRSG